MTRQEYELHGHSQGNLAFYEEQPVKECERNGTENAWNKGTKPKLWPEQVEL